MIRGEALDDLSARNVERLGNEYEIQSSRRKVSRKRSLVLRVIGVVSMVGRLDKELADCVAKSARARIEVAANDRWRFLSLRF